MAEPAAIRELLRDRILCPSDATAYEMVEILLSAWEECHREVAAMRERHPEAFLSVYVAACPPQQQEPPYDASWVREGGPDL